MDNSESDSADEAGCHCGFPQLLGLDAKTTHNAGCYHLGRVWLKHKYHILNLDRPGLNDGGYRIFKQVISKPKSTFIIQAFKTYTNGH